MENWILLDEEERLKRSSGRTSETLPGSSEFIRKSTCLSIQRDLRKKGLTEPS